MSVPESLPAYWAAAAHLRNSISVSARIFTLNIGDNSIQDAGAIALGDSLRQNCRLAVLKLCTKIFPWHR